MHFEFLKTQELAPAIHREIEAFLDRQINSHYLQIPNWMGGGSSGREDKYCAILREQGEIRWFAHCGVTFPAGKWLRSIRSLIVFRGPACDDADLALYGLGKLLERSKQLGFAYLQIAPDWVERPEWSIGSTLSRDGWQVLPIQRSSLRLDLAGGHVLQWRAIRWAKEHGCADYDLGGYREGVNAGPPMFKRGFCESVVQFSPTYRYPLNRLLCSTLDFAIKARSKWRRS